MAKTRSSKDLPSQGVLWNDAIDDADSSRIIDSSEWSGVLTAPLDLMGSRCHHFAIYPDQWWGVLSELARAARYRDAEHAERIITPKYVKRVDEVFPQGTPIWGTLQLQSHQKLVSRWGAYELFVRSNHPEAEPIKEQLFALIDEALGVGGRSVMSSQARREQQRLGSTASFAIERSKQRSLNREVNTMNFNRVAYHVNRWESVTGKRPSEWKWFVPGDPLDYTSDYLQSLFNVIAGTVTTKVRISEERGCPIDRKLVPEMATVFGKRISRECMAEFPGDAQFGIRLEKRKGKLTPVIDVVVPQEQIEAN